MRRGAALALCLTLCGCAALQPAGTTEPVAVSPAPANYAVEVDAPAELATLLLTHLDLARFRAAPQAEGITGLELDRLAAAAPAQVRALLETEGYFAGKVEVRRAADAQGLAVIRLVVQPGPRASVAELDLAAQGEFGAAVARRDAAAQELLAEIRRRFALPVGEPFRQAAWDEGKNAAMARLRAGGYPAATWARTEARVDARQNRVRLQLLADSGPLFRIGSLRIEGLQRYDEEAVRRLFTAGPGTPYDERLLLELQERLVKVGLFEGATVEIDPDPAQAAAATVTVRVREQPLQQATVGAGISANTGPRLTLEHLHRQPLGIPWVMKNEFELGGQRRAWQGDLTSHPVPGLYRNLLGASLEQLRSGEELRQAGSARIGRTQDTPRIERLYFAEITGVRLVNPVGATRSAAVSANYQWVWRDLDSVLLPTEGVSLSAQAALGFAHSSTLSDGAFGRLQTRLTWYRPIGKAWYATARVEAGQVFADVNTGVPDTLLFRAGGDGSVRGYEFRSLGPVVGGALGSGRSLLTASAELSRPLSRSMPSLWGAGFVDAGNAAQSFGQLRPVVGYGVGVRWRSPVGPLRVDLAYGHAVQAFRVHLGLGIAF
jgi:translocation and assembly module TamA